jgi:hypothetical protein
MTVRKKSKAAKWSAKVTNESDALDLEKDIFKSGDPDKIASSLKHTADESRRRWAQSLEEAKLAIGKSQE